MSTIKKTAAIILASLVLFFTILSILAIWDIIEVENVISKSLTTILVIFASSAVVLFIFSVIFPNDSKKNPK